MENQEIDLVLKKLRNRLFAKVFFWILFISLITFLIIASIKGMRTFAVEYILYFFPILDLLLKIWDMYDILATDWQNDEINNSKKVYARKILWFVVFPVVRFIRFVKKVQKRIKKLESKNQ